MTTQLEGEKAAVCKPGRELSPEPNGAGTLLSDFQPPELVRNKSLLFGVPSICYFVTAVLAD